jgi:hypothetical protein
MNNMNNRLIAVMFAMAIILIPSYALAINEYTTNYFWIDAGNYRDQTAQHSPKVACSSDNPDICVVIYYFSGDTFDPTPSLVAKWTFDGFETTPLLGSYSKFPLTVNYESSGINQNVKANYTDYGLPYGITYHNGEFWIAIDAGSDTGYNYIYTFNPYNQSWVQKYSSGSSYNTAFLDIVDKNANDPLVFFFQATHSQSQTTYIHSGFKYLVNGTTYFEEPLVSSLLTSVCCDQDIMLDLRGFVAKNGPNYAFDIDIRRRSYAYGYDSDVNWPKTNNTITKPYTALWYYDGSRIFYKYSNSTTMLGEVDYIPTTDFDTYGDNVTYYTFNESIGQFINYTSFYTTNANFYYAYKSQTNQTIRSFPFEYLRGIFASKETLNPVEIWINYKDQNGNTKFGNALISLSCTGYTTSATATNESVTLYTPCLTGNNLTIITPDLKPVVYSTSFDILCSGVTTYIYTSYITTVDALVTVIDNLRLTRVENALVTVTGVGSNLTDSNGEATINNINAFTNVSLTKSVLSGGCGYSLLPSGNPFNYELKALATNYDLSTTTATFGSITSGVPSYTPSKSIRLDPQLGKLNVRLFTSDLKEINPVCGRLYVNGADNISLLYNGVLTETNMASRFPANFYIDENDTVTLTMTLNYSSTSYSYPSFTLDPNETKNIDWSLPFTSNEIPCCTINDCPSSYCDGQYNRELTLCQSNICKYTSTDCLSSSLCDGSGCFDTATNTTCTKDSDCGNTCYDNYTMLAGRCGGTGVCIGNFRDCDTSCNSTIGVCEELKNCVQPTITNGGAYLFSISFLKGAVNYDAQVGTLNTYFTCDFNKAGKSVCIGGGNTLDWKKSDLDLYGLTINNAASSPADWGVTFDGTTYKFNDMSVTCDNSCKISIQQCANGCNMVTGKCNNNPATTSVKSWQDQLAAFFNGLAPDPLTKAFYWTIVALIWLIALTVLTHGKWEIGAIGGFLWIILGLFVGWYPQWTAFVFIAIAATSAASYMARRSTGG